MAPIMIGGIFFLPLHLFALFIGLIVVLGGWEWANFAGWSSIKDRTIYVSALILLMLAVYFGKDKYSQLIDTVLWIALIWWVISLFIVSRYPDLPDYLFNEKTQLVIGVLVLLPMWTGLYQLKLNPNSTLWIVYLMFVVWGADVGAYFIGRAFGRRKLAPNVSPGKSWEGVFGGMLAVFLVATVAGLYLSGSENFKILNWVVLFTVSVVVLAVSILGDLVESMFKRNRGIKDSSNILPGHGGVMDRADSLTAAVPVFALLLDFI